MNTLIFAGMFLTWYTMVREKSRGAVLALWWLAMLAAVGLLAHHLAGDLTLGLAL